MQLDHYDIIAGRNQTTFEFVSVGPKGRITKVIQFEEMRFPGLFNLAFGDKNLLTNELDDKTVTDNGDTQKVLATVVVVVYMFAELYPDYWIYATGSTAARTRLCRMGINKYFEIVQQDFEILGERNKEWEAYEKGKDYRAFAVHRKTIKFE